MSTARALAPSSCPECDAADVWEMEPDAGGMELICHSCGWTGLAGTSPATLPPVETYLLRSRRLQEYRSAAAREGVPLATWLRNAADRALDGSSNAVPQTSTVVEVVEPQAVVVDAARAALCHRSWAHMPGVLCRTCGTTA